LSSPKEAFESKAAEIWGNDESFLPYRVGIKPRTKFGELRLENIGTPWFGVVEHSLIF
jgi:hypothetical protein